MSVLLFQVGVCTQTACRKIRLSHFWRAFSFSLLHRCHRHRRCRHFNCFGSYLLLLSRRFRRFCWHNRLRRARTLISGWRCTGRPKSFSDHLRPYLPPAWMRVRREFSTWGRETLETKCSAGMIERILGFRNISFLITNDLYQDGLFMSSLLNPPAFAALGSNQQSGDIIRQDGDHPYNFLFFGGFDYDIHR